VSKNSFISNSACPLTTVSNSRVSSRCTSFDGSKLGKRRGSGAEEEERDGEDEVRSKENSVAGIDWVRKAFSGCY